MPHTTAFPKPLPKFIPTLTEVVALPQRAVDVPLDEPEGPAKTAQLQVHAYAQVHVPELSLDSNEIVQRVIQRLDGPLQAEMQSVLADLVADHFRKMEPLLQDELARVLRRRVEDALVEEVVRASR